MTTETRADKNEPTATPESSKRATGTVLPTRARRYTTTVVNRAPTNALTGTTLIPATCTADAHTMAQAAPKAAPDDTPSTDGLAIGLRNKPCSTAPERAKDPPTSPPSTTRGRRTCHKMTS